MKRKNIQNTEETNYKKEFGKSLISLSGIFFYFSFFQLNILGFFYLSFCGYFTIYHFIRFLHLKKNI